MMRDIGIMVILGGNGVKGGWILRKHALNKMLFNGKMVTAYVFNFYV